MLDSEVALAIICLIIFSYLLRNSLLNGRPPLPPGPSIISLISEALHRPSSVEENTYSRWAHKYGDIVHLSILNRHMIIVNSAQVAIDMQESKGAIYSDREITPMLRLTGWSDVVSFSHPGAFFRQQRAYMRKLFGTQAALSKQHNIIENESHRFLQRILSLDSSAEDLANRIRHFAGSIVLKISYGYTTKEQDDPFIFNAERVLHELSLIISLHTLPWMVDIFPSLEKLPDWFPGTRFREMAKQWSGHKHEFANVPFQLVKEQMAAGTAVPSFTSILLAEGNISPEDERAIKLAAMTIYAAGSDTTVSTIQGFFLAMALNPAIFKKAREEIDAVVGSQRLPLISDRPQLPYIDALIRELFRWTAPVPNGVAHKTTRDDVHAGYFIPKGSLILSNIRFMMNDPRLYKEPERFMPERFLGENPERDPHEMVFGFGRRQCPGRLLADEAVFVVCAMSIAAFNIQKKVKNGTVIEPVLRLTSGFVSHYEPYEIDVKPRSTQAVALIQAAVQAESA